MLNIKHNIGYMYSQASRELGDEILVELNKSLTIPLVDLDIGTDDYQEAIYNDDAVSLSVMPKFDGLAVVGFDSQSNDIEEMIKPRYVEINPTTSLMYDNVLLARHLLEECHTPSEVLVERYTKVGKVKSE